MSQQQDRKKLKVTSLSMPELVDLALGGPEPGIVNFNILQYILHIIIKEINLNKARVDFLGEESDKIRQLFEALTDSGKEVADTSRFVYIRHDEDVPKAKSVKKEKGKTQEPSSQQSHQSEINIQAVQKLQQSPKGKQPQSGKPPSPQKQQQAKPQQQQAKPQQQPPQQQKGQAKSSQPKSSPKSGSQKSGSTPRSKAGDKEEDTIDEASDEGEEKADKEKSEPEAEMEKGKSKKKKKVKSIPDSDEVYIEILRSDIPLGPPEYMVKVPSDDYAEMIKELQELKDELAEIKAFACGAEGILEQRQEAIREGTMAGSTSGGANVLELFTMLNFVKRLEATEHQLNTLAALIVPLGLMPDKDLEPFIDDYGTELATVSTKDALKYLHRLLIATIARIGETERHMLDIPKQMQIKFDQILDQLNILDITYNNQLCAVLTQLGEMERDMGTIKEYVMNLQDIMPENLLDLFNKVLQIEEDVALITESSSKFQQEKDELQNCVNIVVADVEELKQAKADKLEIEEALADKVDLCMLTKKVSYDTFDQACEDITRGLEEAIGKLTDQEALFEEALNEIGQRVGTKLDRSDMIPLKDFLNQKLAEVHKQLKTMSRFKAEREAAASKYIKNVNCISCDNDVIMKKKMEVSMKPEPMAPLPAVQTKGPFIAFKLDKVRKQQKPLPTNRNLLEGATSQGKVPADHICNRYCGGSHTTTTPQQRSSKPTNILDQWCKEFEVSATTRMKGIDGQYYKSSQIKSRDFEKAFSVQGDIVTQKGKCFQPEDLAGDIEEAKSLIIDCGCLARPEECTCAP